MAQTHLIYFILVPFVVWRLYSRFRKLVGRQTAHPWKLWLSVTVFPLFFALFVLACLHNSTALMTLIASGVGGLVLSFLGLSLTRFETDAGKLYYTPNAFIGMLLMMALATRVLFRIMMPPAATQDPSQALVNSPLTLVIVGILFCYYASYSAGILRRHAKVKAMTAAADTEVV